MGIGYKTSWLAVEHATPLEVADALGLDERVSMDWTGGTAAAYRWGVFVARPTPTWTIAHSRIHLPYPLDATSPEFPQWLLSLSTRLGDLQFFTTDRIGDFHAWARIDDGRLTRAYCFIGERGEVPHHLGERTDIETEIGVGARWLEDGWQDWKETEWEDWFAAMPGESHVMRIAGAWGLCPLGIPEEAVTEAGIHGVPPGVGRP